MRPHRQQPTRLPHPWDSPGKNTGVGCHFLLQCLKVKSESEVVQSCLTLSDPMDCSLPGSSVHGTFQARVREWVPLPSPHISLNRWHLFFYFWLTSLCVKASWSIHIYTNDLILFLFYGWLIFLCVYVPHLHVSDSLCFTVETNTML